MQVMESLWLNKKQKETGFYSPDRLTVCFVDEVQGKRQRSYVEEEENTQVERL